MHYSNERLNLSIYAFNSTLFIQLYVWYTLTLCVTPFPSVKLMHFVNEVYYSSKDNLLICDCYELINITYFSIFCYATSMCYDTDFHFHASNKVINLTNCQNWYVCWSYIRNDTWIPLPKIVLNTTRIPIWVTKSGKAYNTNMRLTSLHNGCVYLHAKILNTERVTILHVCSWVCGEWIYYVRKVMMVMNNQVGKKNSISLFVHAFDTVYIYMILLSLREKYYVTTILTRYAHSSVLTLYSSS